VWSVFRPGIFVWVVIGVLLVAEGDRLARIIGGVLLAAWLIFAVRSYRRPRTRTDGSAAGDRLTQIYQTSVALSRHPRSKLAAAVLILTAALAVAAYLHWHQAVYHCPPESLVECRYTRKPGWADPLALAICSVGIGAAMGLLVTVLRRRH
jgi:hypothetical protein